MSTCHPLRKYLEGLWSNNPKNNAMTNEWLAAGFKPSRGISKVASLCSAGPGPRQSKSRLGRQTAVRTGSLGIR